MTVQPIRDRRADGHRHALTTDVAELTRVLQGHLGQALLAVIVDAQPRTIARWIAGTSRPSTSSQRLLQNTSQIFELITLVDTPQVARAWFMGMNPHLEDASPAEVLADGDVRAVMAAARAYVAGA